MVTPTTDVKQNHAIHDSFALILKQHRFAMSTVGTVEIVRSAKRRILHEIIHNTRLLFGDRHEIVAVDERFARFLLIVAVATGVEENVIGSVNFGVEKVVAFCAKMERGHGERVERVGRESKDTSGGWRIERGLMVLESGKCCVLDVSAGES